MHLGKTIFPVKHLKRKSKRYESTIEVRFLWFISGAKNQDAVVASYGDGNGIFQSLVAYINVDLTVDDIKTIKKDSEVKLESLFFPKKFIFLKNIPTTTSGKIDR